MRLRLQGVAVVALVGMGLGTDRLAAQYQGRVGRFEVQGLDFRREGAWRKRTNAVRAIRQQLLRARATSALNLSVAGGFNGNRVTGTYYVPVVPIAFSNKPAPFPVSQYQSVFFSSAPVGRPYSLKTFYEELSNGNITLTGTVLSWVTADTTDVYYEDGCNGIPIGLDSCDHPLPNGISSRFRDLLIEALQAADNGSIDWGQFDNDGPDALPNSGDDDGVVDFITFIHPEVDGACGGSNNIWAHRFFVSGLTGGSAYLTQSDRFSGGKILIDDYTMQSGVGGSSSCNSGQIMPIGTVAHETGHAFGLPDLYDTSFITEGIGEWGLMGSGNYTSPDSPSRYEAWSMVEMGWVDIMTLTGSGTVRLSPVATSDTVLFVDVPGTDEYFLIENRQALEGDAAQLAPSAPPGYRKEPGLLVWHIDQGLVDTRGYAAGNTVNTGPIQGVALLQADGLNELRTPGTGDRGDEGDSYPGSTDNRRITALTNPAIVDNVNLYAGFGIDSIYQEFPNAGMIFRFTKRPRSVFTTDPPGGVIVVDGTTSGRYEDVIPGGQTLDLSVNSPQFINAQRSRLTFNMWSDGVTNASRQFVSSTTQPDTLSARFFVEHRLKYMIAGAGMVTTAQPGDFVTGVYLAPNTPVTLTASPVAGNVFAGWTGDTASANPVLTLPMARGYNVTANFAGSVAVTLDQAVNQLLEGLASPILSNAQKVFLDAVGNKNGTYDVGDFLGFARVSGATLSPALMRKVLSGTPVSPLPEARAEKGK